MIPFELLLIFGLMIAGEIMDRREQAQNAAWQLELDRTHHGTPLKPYNWELET